MCLLGSAADCGYSYLIVQAVGHYIIDPSGFATSMDKVMSRTGPFAVGELCDLGEGYVGVDPSCILINLAFWTQSGSPPFGRPDVRARLLHRPSWQLSSGQREHSCLRPSNTKHTYSYQSWGWQIVHAALDAGGEVFGFPGDIKHYAGHLHPEDQTAHCYELQRYETEWSTRRNRLTVGQRCPIVPLRDQDAPRNLNLLICTASGLTPNCILGEHGFNEDTRVVHYDYSDTRLHFKRWLISNWDGEDYAGAMASWLSSPSSTAVRHELCGPVAAQKWQPCLHCFPSTGDFKRHWILYRELRHDFRTINIVSKDNVNLIELIDPHSCRTVVEWNTAFHTLYTQCSQSERQTRTIYADWIHKLRVRNSNVYVYGNDPQENRIGGVVGDISVSDSVHSRNLCFPKEIRKWFSEEIASASIEHLGASGRHPQ
jgi:hypothetical protein